MLLLLILLLPFLGAIAVFALPGAGARTYRGVSLAATTVALAVLGQVTATRWSSGTPVRAEWEWIPRLSLDFALWLDGPALFWAFLVLGIGWLVVYYAGHYMKPSDAPQRFYGSMMLFMGSMLGVVVSNNILLMFVFWELTSITSFLLIGHWAHKGDAIAGARRALLLTATGGLGLMAGIALIAWIMHSSGGGVYLDWDHLWASAPVIAGHPLAPVALVLVLFGVFTKSAQFPFHFWLPGAMEAPTPVSAYLHAATMVKAGIYLLGRITPIFDSLDLWLLLVGGAGVATMLVGGLLALFAKDIKQLLAFSTVSQLGLLTSYYGFGFSGFPTGHLLSLDLLLVASHAFFKAALFMVCGVIDHECGTRDWRRLGGLWRKMPVTFALMLVGCVSMAGGPLTLGYVAKKLYLGAGWELASGGAAFAQVLFWGAVLASALTTAYCIQLVVLPFLGKPRDQAVYNKAHEGGLLLNAAPIFLMALCLLGGLWVPLVAGPIGAMVRGDFYGTTTYYKVAFFQKIDLMFWISLGLYFVAGPLLFFAAPRMDALYDRMGRPKYLSDGFDWFMGSGVPGFATWVRETIHSPSLSRNVLVVVAFAFTMSGLFAAHAFSTRTVIEQLPFDAPDTFAFVLGLTGIVATVIVLAGRRAIFRLMALSMAGLAVGGYFFLYKAPDLAITQILVELVVLIMFLTLLRKLGAVDRLRRTRMARGAGVAVSVLAGAVVFMMTMLAAASPDKSVPVFEGQPTHAEFYLVNAKYPAQAGAHSAGGSNAVNVILVDFRVIDTLGEVMVLVIAALSIAILMTWSIHLKPLGLGMPRVGRGHRPGEGEFPAAIPTKAAEGLDFPRGVPIVLTQLAPVLFVVSLVFSIVLFFSGHNTPGGGFIGGLLTAAALLPFTLAIQTPPQYTRLTRHLFLPIPVGLLLAVGIGLVPVLFGGGIYRSGFKYLDLPLFGEVGFASALVFDLGIYLVVVGVTLVILKSFNKVGRAL